MIAEATIGRVPRAFLGPQLGYAGVMFGSQPPHSLGYKIKLWKCLDDCSLNRLRFKTRNIIARRD